MYAILTGDIVKSSASQHDEWLNYLKSELNDHGVEGRDWEIFRGDSFQLICKPSEALKMALKIRAAVRVENGRDARISIGVGDVDKRRDVLHESNGQAFIFSGRGLDKKKTIMSFHCPHESINTQMRVLFGLMNVVIDRWTSNQSEAVLFRLKNEGLTQVEAASALGISQSAWSIKMSRTGMTEILDAMKYFEDEMEKHFR
ncbi:hypothetical protein [Phaeocystidibacter marisrubri]|uniref:Uncharacterized protein n=1 Tax=Phaeocystidibacter marisrubri TaxID=1577780 RepID=A0A6L3ZJG7_9FLAO|nr:hypothetical protein [Phaeocystidibacter marisrubri]KAB2818021.1 hypothetical protein F8C82_06355 [Phaeocystidibacter marisrubri]GGH72349.1 hypothetical protein GCM10011318_16230 [Phaeocystidibacter marisrubri]